MTKIKSNERTFSMYPQEGASGFPLVKDTSLEKPLSRAVVMGFVEGFGGESHRRRLSLSWFPVKLSEPAE